MAEIADIIRRVEALRRVTPERGAHLGEAANAKRLADTLIRRYGLEARFTNGHVHDRGFVREAAEAIRRENIRRAEQRQAAERQRRFDEMMAEINRKTARRRSDGAKRAWATRRQKRAEAARATRMKEYKGSHGTVSAVERLGRGKPVSAKELAAWFGGITENAAHGRLWRASMSGLLKKVKGGYVVA